MSWREVRMTRRSMTGLCLGGISAGLLGSAAAPAAGAVPEGPSGNAVLDSLRAVPNLKGPLAQTRENYMFSTMRRAREPFDVAELGYAEEEFFVSGKANVYEATRRRVRVAEEGVSYVNRILVRRPVRSRDSSGVVLVDILNASNGYDVEDHWRRLWQHATAEGHTYVGVTSKPINVDALKNFNEHRYDPLTWNLTPGTEREPIVAEPGEFDPFMAVPGAEEGLAWDIITQVGNLLRSPAAARVLGGRTPETILLMGQSQSGVYLNTWTSHFHALAGRANGRNVFDGYLNSVGAVLERPLRQSPEGGFPVTPGREPELDVPFITVTSEGDFSLFDPEVLARNDELAPNRRHYQVPGTPHTDLLSPVSPSDEEVRRSGRLPREMSDEFIAALNRLPLEPAIIAASEALVRWSRDGHEAPPSRWLRFEDGELARDGRGNAEGGVRYGLLDHPLGTFRGAAGAGQVYGTMSLMSAEEFAAVYGTRLAYLTLIRKANLEQLQAGYLTEDGAEQMVTAAQQMLDRMGVKA